MCHRRRGTVLLQSAVQWTQDQLLAASSVDIGPIIWLLLLVVGDMVITVGVCESMHRNRLSVGLCFSLS